MKDHVLASADVNFKIDPTWLRGSRKENSGKGPVPLVAPFSDFVGLLIDGQCKEVVLDELPDATGDASSKRKPSQRGNIKRCAKGSKSSAKESTDAAISEQSTDGDRTGAVGNRGRRRSASPSKKETLQGEPGRYLGKLRIL